MRRRKVVATTTSTHTNAEAARLLGDSSSRARRCSVRRLGDAAQAPGGRAHTPHRLPPETCPGVVAFGVTACASVVLYETDSRGVKRRKLQHMLDSRLTCTLRHLSRRGAVVETNACVDDFIDGVGAPATTSPSFASLDRDRRFKVIERAIRHRFPRVARGSEPTDGTTISRIPPVDLDDAIAFMLTQPHHRRFDVLLVGFDREQVRKPSYPFTCSRREDAGFARTLAPGEFLAEFELLREQCAAPDLSALFAILRDDLGIDVSKRGVDVDAVKWVCLELGSGWANVSLELARQNEDVLCIAIDLDKSLASPAARNHPRVLLLEEDLWEAVLRPDVIAALAGRVLHIHASPSCTFYTAMKRPQRKRRRDEGLEAVTHWEYLSADSFVEIMLDLIKSLQPVSASVENPHNDADGIGSRVDIWEELYRANEFLVRFTTSYCHFEKGKRRKDTDLYVTRNLYDLMTREASGWKGKCVPGTASQCAYCARSKASKHKGNTQDDPKSAVKSRIPIALARSLAVDVRRLKRRRR